MNKNTKRKVEAARDAYGRVKIAAARKGFAPAPADIELAGKIGHKPRRYRHPKVGASAALIVRRLGHHLNSTHQGPR